MEKQRYIKLSEYARNKSITYTTAWNHFKKGLIEGAYKDNTGHVLIPIKSVSKIDYDLVALYARVSSNSMKDNLTRQQERLENYASSNGYTITKSVKEIASGMNDNRKKLQKLFSDDSWNTLIIENKDRLTRFGFNYIKQLLELRNKKIIVINQTNDDKTDLMADMISIIYSFSARMYGLRRKKNKKDIINFLEK